MAELWKELYGLLNYKERRQLELAMKRAYGRLRTRGHYAAANEAIEVCRDINNEVHKRIRASGQIYIPDYANMPEIQPPDSDIVELHLF